MQINSKIDVPIARTNLTDNDKQCVGPLRSGWLVQGSQKSLKKSGVILPDYKNPL